MKNTTAPAESFASADRSTPSGPGRHTTYNPRAVRILLALIRAGGLSDSAAAAKAGISTSSLSRWKREYPDFALALLQAREEFREFHLRIIFEAAKARGGWRASAWILQHVFPGDYSPRAAEREKFQRLAEQQTDLEQAEAPMHDPSPATPANPSRRSSSSAQADCRNWSGAALLEPATESFADLDLILNPAFGKDSHNSRPVVLASRMSHPALTIP